eukprot:TRINITY_DN17950_c0_g3_i1.p1 TRINITY_DN17950_c0_g3~~TRINITY_DN17950_c0_g3_i1.p1  ORF type:complete len:312 (+),score=46.02 TRINITY_DN17950_c0_g3_i1:121-936(+)
MTEGYQPIMGLSHTPLPAKTDAAAGKAMVATPIPRKPPLARLPVQPAALWSGLGTEGNVSCGRPGEPLNKVCLLASNDLEGFLPYTLVISEEVGLQFTSLSMSPDFSLDPVHILAASRVGYNHYLEDRCFGELCRRISARTDVVQSPNFSFEERLKPPYIHLVQLTVRTEAPSIVSQQGPQEPPVIMLVAVQTNPLAEELVKSCCLLRKRRALKRDDPHVEGPVHHCPPRMPMIPGSPYGTPMARYTSGGMISPTAKATPPSTRSARSPIG